MPAGAGLGRLCLDGFPAAAARDLARGWEVAARRDLGWGRGRFSFFQRLRVDYVERSLLAN